MLQLNMPDSGPQRPLKQITAQNELDQMRAGNSNKPQLNEAAVSSQVCLSRRHSLDLVYPLKGSAVLKAGALHLLRVSFKRSCATSVGLTLHGHPSQAPA